ncbi:MAG TPA: hypothetical protein VII13_09505 [Vicinamibacteria bacterium]|jgi:hypothetical protein
MSFDHTLFRAPGPGPMSSWPDAPMEPLGTLAEMQARLAALFPEVRWTPFRDTWFGMLRPPPDDGVEVQMTPDAEGLVRMLTVRRATREEVVQLCKALALVAVDPGFELIRP